MAKRRGLGQGLSALISDELEEKIVDESRGGAMHIKLSSIEPNRKQPRQMFDEDSLSELAESIKQFGIIQPLIVSQRADYYEIIAGERRWRAAKMAGLKEVPVIVKDLPPEEILEISLIENIQRENLNPIEEAKAYQRLIDEFHLKQDELAEKVSKSRSSVTNTLRLLNLSEKVQQMLIDDMITSGHARALLSLEQQHLQYDAATRIFDEKLSVRETEKLIKKLNAAAPEKQKKEPTPLDPVYRQIQDNLKMILGTKVSIHRKNEDSGKIEIDYFTKEELERIIDLIQSIQS